MFDFAAAQRELERCQARGRQRAVVAACAAAGCLPLVFFLPRMAVVVGIAAACEAILAAYSVVSYHDLRRRLALDRDAYVIPDVRRYGMAMCTPGQRAILARLLLRLPSEAGGPLSILLADRIADFWPHLEDLAHDLESSANVVEPTSAVACHELLSHGSSSPLYNPSLPREELAVRLHHIRAGIHENSTSITSEEARPPIPPRSTDAR